MAGGETVNDVIYCAITIKPDGFVVKTFHKTA